MTPQEWLDDLYSRLEANEGVRYSMYYDTSGVPTFAVGYNLTRGDAPEMLAKAGMSYDAVMGGATVTDSQVRALLEQTVAPVLIYARESLQPMHYDLLSDARRAAIVDLVYNLGPGGWQAFSYERGLIDEGVHQLVNGSPSLGHECFGKAADALLASAYAQQVGARARRNAEMLRSSNYVDFHAYE